MTAQTPTPAPINDLLNSVREHAIATYFTHPVEIVSTCCDGEIVTIRHIDGTPFPGWSHGGGTESETKTVRRHLVKLITESQHEAAELVALPA